MTVGTRLHTASMFTEAASLENELAAQRPAELEEGSSAPSVMVVAVDMEDFLSLDAEDTVSEAANVSQAVRGNF